MGRIVGMAVYGALLVVTVLPVPFYIYQLQYLFEDPTEQYRGVSFTQVGGTLAAWEDGEYRLKLTLAEHEGRRFCVESELFRTYDHPAFVSSLESGRRLTLEVRADELRDARNGEDGCITVFALADEERRHFDSAASVEAFVADDKVGVWVSAILLLISPVVWFILGRGLVRRIRA